MASTLTRDEVIKLAHLARIDIAESEIDGYLRELTQILEYVNQLSEVDVDGLKPTNQVTGLSNVWREDKPIDYGYKLDALLQNVPEVSGKYIKVNRMIE
ncbi:MAG TPA: Asp-tRNA(Asn)/Glu-tRNA(Gln) amidotransferase subunit GatC [Candidatus Saccharimonadales bacterium]